MKKYPEQGIKSNAFDTIFAPFEFVQHLISFIKRHLSELSRAGNFYLPKKNRSFSCITGANYPIFALASKMHPMNINVTPAICASLSLFTWDSYPSFSTRHAHIILI